MLKAFIASRNSESHTSPACSSWRGTLKAARPPLAAAHHYCEGSTSSMCCPRSQLLLPVSPNSGSQAGCVGGRGRAAAWPMLGATPSHREMPGGRRGAEDCEGPLLLGLSSPHPTPPNTSGDSRLLSRAGVQRARPGKRAAGDGSQSFRQGEARGGHKQTPPWSSRGSLGAHCTKARSPVSGLELGKSPEALPARRWARAPPSSPASAWAPPWPWPGPPGLGLGSRVGTVAGPCAGGWASEHACTHMHTLGRGRILECHWKRSAV